MTVTTRPDLYPPRPHGGPTPSDPDIRPAAADSAISSGSSPLGRARDRASLNAAVSSVRKAAIVLISLDQSLASQLLSHLDRSAVEAVTWEIARLERIDPDERAAVLEEFYGLGLRRLCFVFDDIVKMSDGDIRAACHDEDLESWALALAGAAAAVRSKVLAALSTGPANRLQHDLDHLGPFRLSDSEAAQLEIADRLRRLYDRGRIALPEPSGGDEVLV
jgi:flagellar motor switch protein FliG